MQHIRDLVSDEFSSLNSLILAQLHSDVALVENIGHYLISAGGKRLRPMLVLLTAGACGYKGDKHIPLATVIEFLHTATLLHDDVVDVSSLRRGRQTANDKWGNAPSVLVGDFIYSRAFQMLVSMGDLRVMKLLSDTTNKIAEGEVLQLTKAGDPSTEESQYLNVITNKTAVLFAAATEGAAILSNTDPTLQQALHHYGLNLGIAFQLIDDALDYAGDPQETGKNIGDDLAEGKPTLPLIYTIQHGSEQQAQLVSKAIEEKDASALPLVIEAVTQCGALQFTHDRAMQFSTLAKDQLKHLPNSPYKTALIELSRFAVERTR